VGSSRSVELLGVAMANTSVGPETFLLLLLHRNAALTYLSERALHGNLTEQEANVKAALSFSACHECEERGGACYAIVNHVQYGLYLGAVRD
jgi:hypothetical protein